MVNKILLQQTEKELNDDKLFTFYQASKVSDGLPENVFKSIIGEDYNKFWSIYDGCIIYKEDKFFITDKGVIYLKDKGYLKKSKEDLEREKSIRIIDEGFAVVDIDGKIIKINRNKVVDYILENNPYVFTVSDTEEIYRYKNGVYQLWLDSEIKDYINELIGKLATRFEQGEILNQIRYTKVINRNSINKDKFLLNFTNGLFNLETKEFSEHSPKIISIIQFPIEYNPEASCPKIEKFLKEVTEKEEDIRGIYELIGYLLLPEYLYQKAWMFSGEGCNGKSTLLSLIEKIIGEKNCSHIPLQQLTGNGFLGAELYGKLTNIYADLPDKALYQTGQFKMLTGGDTLMAEKKFRDPFSFRNFARLIFSCNRIPFTNDDTKAFFRRWIILQFNKVIENPDVELLKKLSTKGELSGLLNKALEGWERLTKTSIFSNERGVEELAEDYMKLSDPAYAFFTEKLIPDSDSYIENNILNNRFSEYCRDNKLPVRPDRYLYKRLPTFCSCYKTVKSIEGKSQNVFVGIRIKGEDE